MVVGLKQRCEYGYDNQYRLVHYLCRERLSAVEIVEGRYVYDPLGRRVGKQMWQIIRYGEGYNARWVRPWKAEMTWYGWDGDRLVTTQTEASRIQTIYSPGSFTPLVRVETPVAALEAAGRHRTLAEKFQQATSSDWRSAG